MKLIGVTGGVGSGKSEILRYMEDHYSCRIVLADEAARNLEAPGGAVHEDLIRLLDRYPAGAAAPVTLNDGRINNPEMARRIFSQPELLEKVNALVHPAVKTWIMDEYRRERETGSFDFFVVEAALLIEGGYREEVDALWYIFCDEQERRRRLRASRGYSDEKIDNILRSQLTEEVFRASADIVIDNSGLLDDSCRQVDRALAAYGYLKKD